MSKSQKVRNPGGRTNSQKVKTLGIPYAEIPTLLFWTDSQVESESQTPCDSTRVGVARLGTDSDSESRKKFYLNKHLKNIFLFIE